VSAFQDLIVGGTLSLEQIGIAVDMWYKGRVTNDGAFRRISDLTVAVLREIALDTANDTSP
jgi:hypothetical protein